MMEMLVSSSPQTLELLPALPQSLSKGEISGMKGRNRVTIESLNWDLTNKAVNCTLKSDIDQDITLIERHGINQINTKTRVIQSPLGQIARIVHLTKGVSTHISIKLDKI
jgi:alpha-L-fucosidase 2